MLTTAGRLAGAAALVLHVAACAGGRPQASPLESAGPPGIHYSCGAATFEANAMAGVPAPQAAVAALDEHLANPGPDHAFLPDEGWRAVAVTGAGATFVAPVESADAPFVYVDVSRAGDYWSARGWGDCRPAAVLRGVPAAEWTLARPVNPTDRRLALLVSERSCSSGQSPEGRILDPVVTYEPDSITILILVQALPGTQSCPGAPAFEHVVELRETVNGRRLLDGGTLPPAER